MMMVKDANPLVETEEQDEASAAMAEAAALMAKAASDKANRSQLMKEVEAALGKIKMQDFPELIDSPVVQTFMKFMDTSGMRPGETKNKGTLAEVSRDWTMQAVHEEIRAGRMKLKTLVPARSMEITWNGVHLYLPANEEVEIPDCFYQEYMRVLSVQKEAQKHEAYMLGHSEIPPSPNFMSPNTGKVRLWSIDGRRWGVPSGTLSTGKIIINKNEEAE